MKSDVEAALIAAGVSIDAAASQPGVASDGAGRWRVGQTSESSSDVFVKIGTGGAAASLDLLRCEAMGLRHLHSLALDTPIVVPQPVAVGEVDGQSAFIAMEYIDLSSRPPRGGDAAFGAGLARIHAEDTSGLHPTFGFPLEGCCGAAPQPNNAELRDIGWAICVSIGLDPSQQVCASAPSDTKVQELGSNSSSVSQNCSEAGFRKRTFIGRFCMAIFGLERRMVQERCPCFRPAPDEGMQKPS